jgi:hypothetical protein
LTVNNNANLQLEQSVTTNAVGEVTAEGGVGGAQNLVLAGKAQMAFGSAAIGDWQLLQKVDASATTGRVFILGASSGGFGNFGNAFGTAANPGWLFGSDFGLLDFSGTGAFNLTSVLLGSGQTFLDVSSASAAQLAKLTTTPGAVLDPTNEIIVKSSVATTLSAATFANIKGFSTLGIGGSAFADGPTGTINLALLPSSINTIIYQNLASGPVTINNQTATLTVNTEDNANGFNLTVGAVGPAAGLNDSLFVVVGNGVHNLGEAIGLIKATGDELFTLTAVGSGQGKDLTQTDFTGLVSLTPTLGGNEQVTISGDTNVRIGDTVAFQGAIQDVSPGGVLLTNNMTISITNTAATYFRGDFVAGTPLKFATDTGANNGGVVLAPAVAYTTNAVTIDASKSGGLIMDAADANFVSSATAAGSLGDVIIGASNPIGFDVFGAGFKVGNVLIGSLGNDTLTSNSLTLPDYLVTNGGADTINLAAGHTGADHVGFYVSSGLAQSATAFIPDAVANSTTALQAPQEWALPGWWGIGTGGAAREFGVIGGNPIPNGFGTSADNSNLNNFNATLDFLDFNARSWAHDNVAGSVFGLSATRGDALVPVNTDTAGLASTFGTAVTVQLVADGGTMTPAGGAGAAPADFFVLSEGNFLNATAVVTALDTGTYKVTAGATLANTDYDFLIAYAGTDGFAHIADLHFRGNGGGAATLLQNEGFVAVSDIVTLVGVSLNTLVTNVSHVHLSNAQII